ncbi:hypothetical protein AAVH_32717, partial [Aphelenchoides avenae]
RRREAREHSMRMALSLPHATFEPHRTVSTPCSLPSTSRENDTNSLYDDDEIYETLLASLDCDLQSDF